MGHSVKATLWSVTLLINTRFRVFVLFLFCFVLLLFLFCFVFVCLFVCLFFVLFLF